jgi:hypothetical protein
MTNESYKIIPEDIEALRRMGFSDEVILERWFQIIFIYWWKRKPHQFPP